MTPELEAAVVRLATHFWRGVHWRSGPNGPRPVREPLKKQHITDHCGGRFRVGLAPIAPGESTTRVAVLDLDSHKGEVSWSEMAAVARGVADVLRERKLTPIPFRSSGGKGVHLYVLWNEPQDAYSVRQLLAECLSTKGLKNGTKGVKAGEVEIFPRQDSVPLDGLANMVVLALAGESLPLDPHTFELLGYEYAEQISDWPKSGSVPVLERSKIERPALPKMDASLAEIKAMLDAIPNDGGPDSPDYGRWRDIVFSVHDATGGSGSGAGLALVHDFSSRNPKYDAEFINERVWPYVKSERSGPVKTVRTLAYEARRHGYVENVLNYFETLPPVNEPTQSKPVVLPNENPFDGQPIAVFANGKSLTWLVRNVLPQAELALIIGESGAGKSFLAFDLAAAIAQGVPWRGLKTRPGRVAIITAEGVHGARSRALAYAKYHDVKLEGLDIIVFPQAPNLMQKEDVRNLAAAVQKYAPISAIFVDTLAATTPGMNENAFEDMGRALANCRALHRATGALVALIHHVGKDASKGARGHCSLKAAADAEITVERKGSLRAASVTKMKDGEQGGEMQFRLITVELGKDEDGEPITSCVVEHAQGVQDERTSREPAGDWQRTVWNATKDLVALGEGETTVGAVIEKAKESFTRDPASPRDVRRQRVVRALDSLVANGWLMNDNGRLMCKK